MAVQCAYDQGVASAIPPIRRIKMIDYFLHMVFPLNVFHFRKYFFSSDSNESGERKYIFNFLAFRKINTFRIRFL